MSEADSSLSDISFSAPDAKTSVSAGNLLKDAREAQGLQIAVLAVALKVPVKKLEALEADRFDLLPDLVFARALAASICRTLKIDPAPVLEKLPSSNALHLSPKVPAMSVPFRVPQDRLGSSFKDQLSKPLIYVVVLLLIGGLVLVFAPLPQLAGRGTTADPVTVSEGEQSLSPTEPETRTTALAESTSIVVGGLAPQPNLPLVVSPGVGAASTGTSALTPNVSAITEAGTGTVADLVVFTARGASWVEVIDANASVRLRKTLVSGDVVSASGVAPLSVVVGRADVVDVQLHGKPFDLAPIARENVARFEVK